ncbi:MAG: ERF family protein, partial [Xanthobacteraceae bacterium]|nr:ERF family protein [Xanthobacteraceae bacterium]
MTEAATALTRPEPRPLAITPMQMLQIAVEQGADLDKLQKLMDLQERWEANEARKAYVAAINAFKAEPPAIQRNRHVRYETRGSSKDTEYDHATLDNVVAAIGPGLSKHGLSHR